MTIVTGLINPGIVAKKGRGRRSMSQCVPLLCNNTIFHFRFALKTVVSDKKLKCPGRSNPNNNNNNANTLGIVQVVLLSMCVVLLCILSTIAVVRFVRGRTGAHYLHEDA